MAGFAVAGLVEEDVAGLVEEVGSRFLRGDCNYSWWGYSCMVLVVELTLYTHNYVYLREVYTWNLHV